MSQTQGEQSSVEVAEPEKVDIALAGDRLKKARLALGLSVIDVSARLKLSVNKIDSFERGDVAGIATPVFVAGYLRSYARLLELSEDDVLAGFEMLSTTPSSQDEATSANDSFENIAAPLNGVIFPKLSSAGNNFSDAKSLLMPVVLGMLVIAIVYFLLLGDESLEDAKVVPEASDKSAIVSRISVDDPVVVADTMAVIPSSVEHGVPAVNETAELTVAAEAVNETEADLVGISGLQESNVEAFRQSELALVFNGDSWVEVTDSRGERLVYRLAKAGMSRTVTGVAPFRVQLGYVPGVEIFYNGVPYDLSRFTGRRSAQFNVGDADDSSADG